LSNKQWLTSRRRTVIAKETDCNSAIVRLIPRMAVVRGELTVCGADSSRRPKPLTKIKDFARKREFASRCLVGSPRGKSLVERQPRGLSGRVLKCVRATW